MKKFYFYYYNRILEFFGRLLDYFYSIGISPESLIIKENTFNTVIHSKTFRRLCIFSHFDPQSSVDPYVVNYLQSLFQLGVNILFVTTSEHFPETEIAKINSYCFHIIHRKNISLDFGSWKIGLLRIKNLSGYDQLILANDSVYGPLFSLTEIFDNMTEKNYDLWSITNSQEIYPHLQSYFLVFNRHAFLSKQFQDFWNNFLFLPWKKWIIRRYEIGLSYLAERSHWKLGSYMNSLSLSSKKLNPTLYYWDTLIEEFHCPFLKTEVLKLNRLNSPRVAQWRQFIQQHTCYNPDLIKGHLDRIKMAPGSNLERKSANYE